MSDDIFVPTEVELDSTVLVSTIKVLQKLTGKSIAYQGKAADEQRKLLHQEIEDFLDASNPARFDKVGGFEAFVDKVASGSGTCFGACIDLRTKCAVCPDQSQCLSSFVENSRDAFVTLGKKYGIEPQGGDVVDFAKLSKLAKVSDKDIVVVFEGDNPCKNGSLEHAWIQRIQSWGNMNVETFLTITKGFYKESKEASLLRFEKLEAGCLAKDLPKDYVAQLSKQQKRELGL